MSAWADVSGLKFVSAARSGFTNIDIAFSDDKKRAFTDFYPRDGITDTSFVNVDRNWDTDPISLNSYWFQTYMHEIGHALGLGHAGNYNGTASWVDRTFPIDSWQASVMSYFSQQDTPRDDGDFAFLATVMPADILAIQKIYGTNVNTRTGDTVYGANSNVGGYLGKMFAALFDFEPLGSFVDLDYAAAMTIFDTGGIDTLNLSKFQSRQHIDLNPYAASDVGGVRGSIVIGPNTVIEHVVGGQGIDRIIGNAAANRLLGGQGNDRLESRLGHDTLSGGAGDDVLNGGSGRDTARYYGDASVRVDLGHSNAQSTGQGRDRFLSIEDAHTAGGADRLFGTDGANRLTSGARGDRLTGRDGDDSLTAGTGNDLLWGNQGADTLRGQAGDDTLSGGYGRDTFVFSAGRDMILDFDLARDTLALARSLWGGARLTAQEVVAEHAKIRGGDVVLQFASGVEVRLDGLAIKAGLADAIDIL